MYIVIYIYIYNNIHYIYTHYNMIQSYITLYNIIRILPAKGLLWGKVERCDWPGVLL